jgi:hypothetical protein
MDWLKFVLGGFLIVASLFGIGIAVFCTIVAGAVPALEGLSLPVWSAVGIGIVSFIVFLSGVYLVRS